MYVTRDMIQRARRTDLGAFLMHEYPSEFKFHYDNVVMVKDESFSVGKESSGFSHFSTGDHGNAIDFLVKYKGLEFTDAVVRLNTFQDETGSVQHPAKNNGFYVPPRVANGQLDHVNHYLQQMHVPQETVRLLIEEGLLYEDARRNAVFLGKKGDYYELVGTGSTKFFSVKSATTFSYWQFPYSSDLPPENVLICQSAMDAICLSTILNRENRLHFMFVSIAGRKRQNVIDYFRDRYPVTLAFGNDSISNQFIQQNNDLGTFRPSHATWTEDFLLSATESANSNGI